MKRFRTLAAGIFALLAVSFASAQTIVVLASPVGGKVLAIDATAAASPAEHVPVVMQDYVNTPNQRWVLHSAGGGKYYIYNTEDGRALESTYTPLHAGDLDWGNINYMWRFGPAVAPAGRVITSASTGMAVAGTADSWTGLTAENAPVLQIQRGSAPDSRLESWFAIPVNSVPNCQSLSGSVYESELFGVSAWGVRNALKVIAWVTPVGAGADSAFSVELFFGGFGDYWTWSTGPNSVYQRSAGGYDVDAYALGADSQWHYLGSTQLHSNIIAPPPRP
jgi:hypothetical protein